MSKSIPSVEKQPWLFLFDGGADGVRSPALDSFTGALLKALSKADPVGSLQAELRGGLPLLSDFAGKVSKVVSDPKGGSRTTSYDMGVYRVLIWDMANALTEPTAPNLEDSVLDVLRRRDTECLAISDASDVLVSKISENLGAEPGFVGAFRIDKGNPTLRYAFFDGLMHLALISEGAIIQARTYEGDEWYELNGASTFQPGGVKWVDYRFGRVPDDYKVGKSPLSERGALTNDRLARKTHITVEGRVLKKLARGSWSDQTGKTYRFQTSNSPDDILQAILPEGKFTNYLFNRDHQEGGSKAKFIIDTLEFQPDDWRFLAAQLYDGLLLSDPKNVKIVDWPGGYDARFEAYIQVKSRSDKTAILKTIWALRPGFAPKLVTAMPASKGKTCVKPPSPAVLRPAPADDTWCQELFDLAHRSACIAHKSTIPAPMFLTGYGVIESGECGSASITVPDARTGFARWLIKTGKGDRGYKGGASIPCLLPSQSLERAKAYAIEFARILALNGIVSRVDAFNT